MPSAYIKNHPAYKYAEAIISGDRNQAEKLMREHMETIEKYILEIAQQQGENSLVFHR